MTRYEVTKHLLIPRGILEGDLKGTHQVLVGVGCSSKLLPKCLITSAAGRDPNSGLRASASARTCAACNPLSQLILEILKGPHGLLQEYRFVFCVQSLTHFAMPNMHPSYRLQVSRAFLALAIARSKRTRSLTGQVVALAPTARA